MEGASRSVMRESGYEGSCAASLQHYSRRNLDRSLEPLWPCCQDYRLLPPMRCWKEEPVRAAKQPCLTSWVSELPQPSQALPQRAAMMPPQRQHKKPFSPPRVAVLARRAVGVEKWSSSSTMKTQVQLEGEENGG